MVLVGNSERGRILCFADQNKNKNWIFKCQSCGKMSNDSPDPRIFPFKDLKTEADQYLDYVGSFDKDDNVLVIDNGNHNHHRSLIHFPISIFKDPTTFAWAGIAKKNQISFINPSWPGRGRRRVKNPSFWSPTISPTLKHSDSIWKLHLTRM